MVDDYCTTIPDSFPSALFHMLLAALILSSLLLHIFALRFAHVLTSGYLLIFKVALYLYRHADITSLYLFFLSWYTLDAILKVITSSPLSFTNQRRRY